MESSSLLDLGGNSSAGSITSSHLGSGSPKISAKPHHSKRAKHYSEESKHRIALLKSDLRKQVATILASGKISSSYALIYSDVERLCISKHSEQALLTEFIFSEIHKTLRDSIVPRVIACLEASSDRTEENSAKTFLEIYRGWEATLKLLSQLFLYLDRSYLLHHPKHTCIRQFGIESFVDILIENSPVYGDGMSHDPLSVLVSNLFCKYGKDRSDQNLRQLISTTISALENLDTKKRLSANCCLNTIIMRGYSKLSKTWLKDRESYVHNLLEHMNQDGILLREASKKLDFVKELNAKVRWTYLLSDLNLYLKPSLPILTQRQNLKYLRALRCFCEASMDDYGVDSTKIFLEIWGKYVQEKLRSVAHTSNFISKILELLSDLSYICEKGFATIEAFEFEVRSASTKVFGEKDMAAMIVFHLSKFCDGAMKQAVKSDETFSELEENVLTIFKLLPDKSAFMSIYEKDLSKRILMAKSFHFVFEKRLVDAVVSVVGENDDNFKLRAMLRDYFDSKEQFSYLTLSSAPNTDFSALVLEKKVWPDIPSFSQDICLPQAIMSVLEEFEKVYETSNRKHKKLDWKNYTLHQITLTASFASGPKDLQVNLLQAIILMLFEEFDSMTIETIHTATKMSEKFLIRVITSLSTEKYPILKVSGSEISFNTNFRDKSSKIKLPMGREKDIPVVEGAKKLVHESRTTEIRSALVRLMKAHKSMLYTELMGKAIEALAFRGRPQVQDIKAEIEHLISTDYIARDAMGTTLSYIP